MSLQSVPTSPNSNPPQTMVNAQQTSTAVATASGGMVLYEHNEDGQERVVSMLCIYTFVNVHQVNTNAHCV